MTYLPFGSKFGLKATSLFWGLLGILFWWPLLKVLVAWSTGGLQGVLFVSQWRFWQSLIHTLKQTLITGLVASLTGVILLVFWGQARLSRWHRIVWMLPWMLPSLVHVAVFFFYFPSIRSGHWRIGLINGLALGGVFFLNLKDESIHWQVTHHWLKLLGITGWKRLRLGLKVWQPVMARLGILGVWVAFTSLSIPMALGGPLSENVEMFLYQKWRQEGLSPSFLTAALTQTLIIWLLTLGLGHFQKPQRPVREPEARPGWRQHVLAFLWLGFYAWPSAAAFKAFLKQLPNLVKMLPEWLPAWGHTLALSCSVGLTFLTVLVIYAHLTQWDPQSPQKFIRLFVPYALAGAVAGLPSGGPWEWKILWTYGIVYWPWVLQSGFFDLWARNWIRRVQARCWGIQGIKLWRFFWWPGGFQRAWDYSLGVATWAFFDYGILSFFIDEPRWTLAQWVRGLYQTHQWESAQAFWALMILSWAVTLGGVHVAVRRLSSGA